MSQMNFVYNERGETIWIFTIQSKQLKRLKKQSQL